MKRVLFICSQNRLRSPTAEKIFSNRAGFEVASAGTHPNTNRIVSAELLEWADVVCVMEEEHRNALVEKFEAYLRAKRVVCLNIPDRYPYMDPELIRLLEEKAGPFFASA